MVAKVKVAWNYFTYLLRHKWFVFWECWQLGIPLAGLTHDLDKFLPHEFWTFAKFYANRERIVTRDVQSATLCHIHRAPHHWQWWYLLDAEDGNCVLEMTDRYRREMLADWRGAAKARNGNVVDWYKKHRDNILVGTQTRRWLDSRMGEQ